MKLIYIAYGNVSVFDSQVIALLNHYIELGIVREIVLIIGIDYKGKSKINNLTKINKKIIVKYYKQYPQYFLIEQLTIQSITKALKKIDKLENYTIHVRNDVLSHYVYKSFKRIGVRTNRIIADVRGAGFEQLIEFSNKSKLVVKLKKVQRKQVYKSLIKINNISVVSESLKKYLVEKIGNKSIIKINSCLANKSFKFDNTERKILREKLKVNSDEYLLVLSTGGNNAWQNTEETISFLTKKNVKILNLSKTVIEHEKVINKFVPYEDMFKYLCAADAAIIWRNNSITNKVASPVKFSEYISCGLPVITNESIDLITNYINLNNCGKIIFSLDSFNKSMIKNLKKLDRNSISIKGQKDLGIDAIADQYMRFYKSII